MMKKIRKAKKRTPRPPVDVVAALAAQGLIDSGLASQMQTLQAPGRAPLGDPLPIDELLALAEIDQADIARAAEDWRQSANPANLLDARQQEGVPNG